MFQLTTWRGDTPRWPVTCTAGEPPAPVSLVGATLLFGVKTDPALPDDQALLLLAVSSHEDAAGGKTAIALTSAQTLALEAGAHHCDLKLLLPGGAVRTLDAGRLLVRQPVTHQVA